MKDYKDKITLDLNRDRIRSVLYETYTICKDYLQTDFHISQEAFVSEVEPFIGSNRVSIPVRLKLSSKKYPTLVVEVNLRRAKVIARMFPKKKQAALNHMLKVL